MRPQANKLMHAVLVYFVYLVSLIGLVTGTDAFLLLHFARVASVLGLAILSVHTWRTIWLRYSRSGRRLSRAFSA